MVPGRVGERKAKCVTLVLISYSAVSHHYERSTSADRDELFPNTALGKAHLPSHCCHSQALSSVRLNLLFSHRENTGSPTANRKYVRSCRFHFAFKCKISNIELHCKATYWSPFTVQLYLNVSPRREVVRITGSQYQKSSRWKQGTS